MRADLQQVEGNNNAAYGLRMSRGDCTAMRRGQRAAADLWVGRTLTATLVRVDSRSLAREPMSGRVVPAYATVMGWLPPAERAGVNVRMAYSSNRKRRWAQLGRDGTYRSRRLPTVAGACEGLHAAALRC